MLGGGAGIFWSDTSGAQRPKLISSFIYQGGWYGEAESANAQSWSLEVQIVCAGPDVDGYQIVVAATPDNTTTYKQLTAFCPEGKKMLGGGAGIFWSDTSGAQRPKLISSFMYQGGWYGEAESSNTQSWHLEVQVVCANVN